MLSTQDIKIIQSTVPVLEVHGNEITRRFYELLFEHHPELLHIFNHANQSQGKQQAALAAMVYAAAKYIDRLETVLPAVTQVAHKHRSLGVKPEHYPIVGKYLLLAIKDVLGEAATDEIIEAWGNAYQVIANVFIQMEAKMYEEASDQPGGWEGFRAFEVIKTVDESDIIRSFYLRPADQSPLAPFEPGQYISVKVEIPGDSYTQIRQYSLSDAPGLPHYRISVKKESARADSPAGRVSSYLHDQIHAGDTLWLSAPAGDFKLEIQDDRPLVLIGGGIGITPLISMLQAELASGAERDITFIHAAQHMKVQALGPQIRHLEQEHDRLSAYFCYSDPQSEDEGYDRTGRVDQDWLAEVVQTTDAHFYFCGPTLFMKSLRSMLLDWGVQEHDLHYEFFGPKEQL
ncbi:NO-inducible flavohemoprotein [Paenibacillus urinalis]|uniref:Flavohemoprotein n=1 Tax=Paenibacillus urinalis TaxID=521520 RepID=A0ABY7XCF5_9BACL|nr:NO-inducible flavohemoprotein [Paenibacillus urinalis]WDI03406.1 NO-inducible flavohemoprotein [Paenibacillus urinalis]